MGKFSEYSILAILVLLITFLAFSNSIPGLFSLDSMIGKASSFSSIDGRRYRVQERNSREKEARAADVLAQIRQTMDKFVYTSTKIPSYLAKRLRNRYCSSCIHERNRDLVGKYTDDFGSSFTVDKRDMIFCLSENKESEKKGEFHDLNLLIFVAIHELAHVASLSHGHNEEFYVNFKALLRAAVKDGVWRYEDYSQNPRNYCGIDVTTSLISRPQ
jgi:hypothetical protein